MKATRGWVENEAASGAEPPRLRNDNPGTNLLSPYDYHRPNLLNCCVRDGNRCFQVGMRTGENVKIDSKE